MMANKPQKVQTTKVEFIDGELALLWGCVMNSQIPAAAAETVVSLKNKLKGPVEAAMKRAQEQQQAQQQPPQE